jgi:diguanylate cyclase (GGDEF)-like protein
VNSRSPESPDSIIWFLVHLSLGTAIVMDLTATNTPGTSSEFAVEAIREKLQKLEKRDWWLWALAVLVMLLLTVAVVSMSFPRLFSDDPFFQYSLDQSVRGLVGLVLLFNTYVIYQQHTIKRLRREFSEQLDQMGYLRLRAEEFHKLATTDPLTGLANRRTAEQRMILEVARAQRYGNTLTVVALDLDSFKQINDTYGHPAGDLVLREFAGKLASATRGSDLAVRIGGDEFQLLLSNCRPDQVPILLNRLRPMQVSFQGSSIAIEFSAGWVNYQAGETPEQFLERADRTLYVQKRSRKDQAEVTHRV